nr:threonylcarbamoyladenosine tRNA methylthiotransferase [Maniola hyperantus]
MPGAFSEIIDDIEDLISSQDITPKERYASRKNVSVRSKKKDTKDLEPVEKVVLESVVPGTQTIYMKTWGCAHNNSDSEYMAGLLAAQGYKLTEDKWQAQLWLLNSCTVKSPAEDHFKNEIELGQSRGIHVVLAGCVPQGAPRAAYLQGLSVVGVQQIDRIVEIVEETLKGHTVRLFSQKKTDGGKKAGGASLLLPKVRKNPLIEIIPINTGCLNQCTYCKTKHARGELGSYPPEEIVERARQSFKEGVCEIWLTSEDTDLACRGELGSYPLEEIVERARQSFKEGVCEIWLTSEDTGTYGRDIGTTLPALLWQLVEVIPEGCRLRLGMTNPPYILEHLAEIAQIMHHPRVYKFLHVPVQSGSDEVLSDMKREYTRADFERVVDYLRFKVPGMTIATDIICGFPTETEANFEDTMSLCKKYKFPSLFINQFFPRPGTPAAKMQRVPGQEVKKRTKQLSDFFRSYEPYGHKIGETQEVLVTDISHDKNYYVAHNQYYEQVLVPKEDTYMGKMLPVQITSATKFSMMGQPIGKHVAHNEYYEQVLVPKEDTYMGKMLPVQITSATKFSMMGQPIGKHVAHNEYYEQVLVPKEDTYMGKMLPVQITSATKFSMMGQPIGKHVAHNEYYEQVLVPKEDTYMGKMLPVQITSATKFSMMGQPIGKHVAHNEYYEQVLVPKEDTYMGKMLPVQITSATKFSMMGQPIDKPKTPGLAQPLKKGEVSGLTKTESKRTIPVFTRILLVAVVLRLIWAFYYYSCY